MTTETEAAKSTVPKSIKSSVKVYLKLQPVLEGSFFYSKFGITFVVVHFIQVETTKRCLIVQLLSPKNGIIVHFLIKA